MIQIFSFPFFTRKFEFQICCYDINYTRKILHNISSIFPIYFNCIKFCKSIHQRFNNYSNLIIIFIFNSASPSGIPFAIIFDKHTVPSTRCTTYTKKKELPQTYPLSVYNIIHRLRNNASNGSCSRRCDLPVVFLIYQQFSFPSAPF